MFKFPLKVTITMCIVVLLLSYASASIAKKAQANATKNHVPTIEELDPLNKIDCAGLKKMGIEKQENMRAGRIRVYCGMEPAGSESYEISPELPSFKGFDPFAIGGVDVDVITGTTDPYPTVTQSESAVWGNGNTVFAAINTSPSATCAGGSYGHGSYSLDGGVTFTRLCPNPFATGHGQNYGDPMVVFNCTFAFFKP